MSEPSLKRYKRDVKLGMIVNKIEKLISYRRFHFARSYRVNAINGVVNVRSDLTTILIKILFPFKFLFD